MQAFFIVGGAGFIGSHFVERLLTDKNTSRVTIYDNMSSGRDWHFASQRGDDRFSAIRGDAKDLTKLTAAMGGHDAVIHLASNPDISKARSKPDIDFYEGTLLTHQVIEAMRLSGAKTILYASGSGVYGDLGETEAREGDAIGRPISTYGASKTAGEALISRDQERLRDASSHPSTAEILDHGHDGVADRLTRGPSRAPAEGSDVVS